NNNLYLHNIRSAGNRFSSKRCPRLLWKVCLLSMMLDLPEQDAPHSKTIPCAIRSAGPDTDQYAVLLDANPGNDLA
ncbi:MAG: hypothetical protein WDA72_13195, partial [Desulfomonilia bacterium]